ncbi:uncharacterized protein LOC111328675 [Stylophora pistillata]|uniref:Uncharacterized protein n=1 Tax=Stylophora pistillata TaxID=50429 RepID=A0A2B4SCD3_STYPI|nr:uncharacterized protein LOC111328675 [Stylophora pistillata]PFX26703.1 hypothetical protein AWC38_SpisGene8608 [Stylophora pistillata]
MAFYRRDLKIISIAQLVMAGILFVLGMVDHFEVRYMYASLILMPVWISLLVVLVGIMGLVLVKRSSPYSALTSGLISVSMTSAALAVLTIFTYAMALNDILFYKYYEAETEKSSDNTFPWFAGKNSEIQFQKEEKTMIAVHVLIIMCSILEVILAMASVRTGKALAKEPKETQASVGYRQVAEEDVPLLFSSDQETD